MSPPQYRNSTTIISLEIATKDFIVMVEEDHFRRLEEFRME
jgi:hypothetical protein